MFEQLSLTLNAAIFVGAAVVVWIAGTRIARLADAIARKSGLGHAAVGLLLLAGITSLPEIAVTATASIGGNAQLAVNNLLGSVALQVAILAAADALIGRDALTAVIPDPEVLLQVALNTLVLGLIAAVVVAGDRSLFGSGVGIGAVVVCVAYAGSIGLITRASKQQRHAWVAGERHAADDAGEGAGTGEGEGGADKKDADAKDDDAQRSPAALAWRTALAAAAILVAGFLLSKTGEAIAAQTRLGQSLGGFLLVGVSTSLPEISTVVASVRLGRYVMAVSDIFGTNLFNGGLLLVVDALYRGGPVLAEVGPFSAFAALLGVVLSALFLAGLVERRDRTVLRMGYDSFAGLLVYAAGVAVLFTLQ